MTNDIVEDVIPQDPVEPTTPVVEDNLDDLDYDTLKERVVAGQKREKTLDAQRIAYKEKLAKAQQSKSQPKTEEPVAPSVEERLSNVEHLELKRQFGHEHGLSPVETDAVFKHNQNPTKETLDEPFVKGGIEAVRTKDRVDNAIPSSSPSSRKVNGKTFSDMTPDERKANYKDLMEATRRR